LLHGIREGDALLQGVPFSSLPLDGEGIGEGAEMDRVTTPPP